MTFKTLQDSVLEDCTFDPALGSSATPRVRVKRYINEVYSRILRSTSLGRLLTSTETTTITLVDGTRTYSVTGAKVLSIYNAVTGQLLREITLSDIRELDPTGAVEGTPYAYAIEKVGATTLTVRLYPIPSAAGTLKVDTQGAVTALSGDNDVPILPEEFQWLLRVGACALEFSRMEQLDRYRLAQNEFDEGLRDLRFFLAKSGRKSNAPRTIAVKWSQLGPWFPSEI